MAAADSIRMDYNTLIPMRDGVKLSIDIFRPDDSDKHPSVLIRSPYHKSAIHKNPEGFIRMARSGYAVVFQDHRGKGASEGIEGASEQEDGYDTIEWLASQQWCTGKIGMFGMSALGHAQWDAAIAQPPHLTTICPANTLSGTATFFRKGVIQLEAAVRMNLTNAQNALAVSTLPPEENKMYREKLNRIAANMDGQYNFLPLKDIPINNLPELLEPVTSKLITHMDDEDYRLQFRHPAELEKVLVPAMHTADWFDPLVGFVFESYHAVTERGGSELARNNQKLIMGPWLNDVIIGAQGEDNTAMHIRWYDYWLKGIDNGIMKEPKVRLFVMGANVWRDEHSWPIARTRYTNYYFHSAGHANTLHGDGSLATTAPEGEKPDTYIYDPGNPVRSKGLVIVHDKRVFDQTEVEERNDVLVYSTPVLNKDVEVTGPVEVRLFASSSAVDTDFTGKLVDVHPEGIPYNLNEGIIRARYRESLTEPKLLKQGEVYEFALSLGCISNVFKAGHRIRLEISSSNFPKYDRNLNTGHPVGQDAEIKVAMQTVFHDTKYPSHIILPVIPE
jgi:uncharacterized protein